MITAPDPNARNSSRYLSDLSFRVAADKAHSMAMQHCTTLQLLKVPCDFVPTDDDWQATRLAQAICDEAPDY